MTALCQQGIKIISGQENTGEPGADPAVFLWSKGFTMAVAAPGPTIAGFREMANIIPPSAGNSPVFQVLVNLVFFAGAGLIQLQVAFIVFHGSGFVV